MPPVAAARRTEYVAREDERYAPPSGRPSEDVPYEPRFRVVSRKPLVQARRKRPTQSWFRTLFLAVVPGVLLLVYVLFWTLAMRGGYYKAELQAELQVMKLEQAELEADKRRLQSPGLILQRAAAELKMQPADNREFARLPGTERLAKEPVSSAPQQ